MVRRTLLSRCPLVRHWCEQIARKCRRVAVCLLVGGVCGWTSLRGSVSASGVTEGSLDETSSGKDGGCWTWCFGGTAAATCEGVRALLFRRGRIDLALVGCWLLRGIRRSFFRWLGCGIAQKCRKSPVSCDGKVLLRRVRVGSIAEQGDGCVVVFTPLLALLQGLCCLGGGNVCGEVFGVASGL